MIDALDDKVFLDYLKAKQPIVKKKRGRKKGSTNKKTNKNLDIDSEELYFEIVHSVIE